MRTVMAGLALMLILVAQVSSAYAQAKGCREGCPKGYRHDGCECK